MTAIAVKIRRGRITSIWKRLHLSRRAILGNSKRAKTRGSRLLQSEVGAIPESIRVRTQRDVNPLCCILQVEMSRLAETTRAESSGDSLKIAAAGHIEFVNDHALCDVGHFHMEREKGPTSPEMPKEETGQRTAAIDEIKLPFDQPTDPRCLIVVKNPGRGDFFELLLQIIGKFDWRERLANRHLAL